MWSTGAQFFFPLPFFAPVALAALAWFSSVTVDHSQASANLPSVIPLSACAAQPTGAFQAGVGTVRHGGTAVLVCSGSDGAISAWRAPRSGVFALGRHGIARRFPARFLRVR
jgi:hypothetical protein